MKSISRQETPNSVLWGKFTVGHRTGAEDCFDWSRAAADFLPTRIAAVLRARWGLLARSQQICMQCLCTRPQSLCSLDQVSVQDLHKKGLLVRSLYKISIRALLANAHGHFTRAILCGIWQGNCRTLISGPLTVLCEPAQSKCTWTFQKSHFVEFYRETAGR